MSILLVGINHRTAPVEIREQLAFSRDGVATALMLFRNQFPNAEAAIISTCNRVEMLVASDVQPPAVADVLTFLAQARDLPVREFKSYMYQLISLAPAIETFGEAIRDLVHSPNAAPHHHLDGDFPADRPKLYYVNQGTPEEEETAQRIRHPPHRSQHQRKEAVDPPNGIRCGFTSSAPCELVERFPFHARRSFGQLERGRIGGEAEACSSECTRTLPRCG